MLRIAGLSLAATLCLHGQSYPAFEKRVQAVVQRPEYRHARFGMEFYSIEDGKILYSLNPQELFVPGSTTKVLSVGTALELLGPDFRFHTKVYRTGPLQRGSVDGDLVLVASGDPDLSNRIQPDGTMVFENEDHSYDGFAEAKPVPGDPLAVIKRTRIEGRRSRNPARERPRHRGCVALPGRRSRAGDSRGHLTRRCQ